MLTGVIAVMVGVSVLSAILNPNIAAFFRLGLNILFSVALFRGYSWAKWVVGILAIIGGVGGIFLGIALMSQAPTVGVIGFVIGGLYIASASFLFGSKAIREFMDSQNSK